MRVQSLCQEDPLKEGMATHPSTLAWRIPWTEEPGGMQSIGSHRARHDYQQAPLRWETKTQKVHSVYQLARLFVSK